MTNTTGEKYTDLDTVKEFITLLQKDKGVHFGNDKRFVTLAKREKAREAFAIAFQAVFGEALEPQTLRFIFEALEGLAFYMKEYDAKRVASGPALKFIEEA